MLVALGNQEATNLSGYLLILQESDLEVILHNSLGSQAHALLSCGSYVTQVIEPFHVV